MPQGSPNREFSREKDGLKSPNTHESVNLGRTIFLPPPTKHQLTLPQGEAPNSPTTACVNG